MTNPGCFVPFMLLFKTDHNDHDPTHLDVHGQALAILDEARKRVAAGAVGVAITYSANYNQTLAIHKTYTSGGWNTHTSGSNQAMVMAEMERLMGLPENSDIQMKLRIAPISTMTYPTALTPYQYIFLDLVSIKVDLLDQGWDVLGWRNQTTPSGEYAVGGGVAGNMPSDCKELIQSALNLYEKQYAPPVGNTP